MQRLKATVCQSVQETDNNCSNRTGLKMFNQHNSFYLYCFYLLGLQDRGLGRSVYQLTPLRQS